MSNAQWFGLSTRVLSFSYRSVALLLLTSSSAMGRTDVEGSTDHPLLSRYPEFTIEQYSAAEFDKSVLPVGPIKYGPDKKETMDLLPVQGQVTNIKYRLDDTSVSLFQIFVNYQRALEKLGAEILYACADQSECMELGENSGGGYLNAYLRRAATFRGLKLQIAGNYGVISARLQKASQTVSFLMIVSAHDVNKVRRVHQSIIVDSDMEEDNIGIGGVDELTATLAESGTVVLEGILFAHDTAELSAQSEPVLVIVADFLKRDTKTEFYVAGHTDRTGDYDYNVRLSQQRAAAVVRDLVARGIKRDRLTAVGVGPVSPKISNRAEIGRSVNRRVELVEK